MNYKSAYLHLFNHLADTIDTLSKIEQEVEKIFLKDGNEIYFDLLKRLYNQIENLKQQEREAESICIEDDE